MMSQETQQKVPHPLGTSHPFKGSSLHIIEAMTTVIAGVTRMRKPISRGAFQSCRVQPLSLNSGSAGLGSRPVVCLLQKHAGDWHVGGRGVTSPGGQSLRELRCTKRGQRSRGRSPRRGDRRQGRGSGPSRPVGPWGRVDRAQQLFSWGKAPEQGLDRPRIRAVTSPSVDSGGATWQVPAWGLRSEVTHSCLS